MATAGIRFSASSKQGTASGFLPALWDAAGLSPGYPSPVGVLAAINQRHGGPCWRCHLATSTAATDSYPGSVGNLPVRGDESDLDNQRLSRRLGA